MEKFKNLYLEKLYLKQLKFQNFVQRKKLKDFFLEERFKQCEEHCFYLNMKVAEFVNAIKRKDQIKIKKELRDLFLYSVNLAIILGIEEEDFWKMIETRQKENFKRIGRRI